MSDLPQDIQDLIDAHEALCADGHFWAEVPISWPQIEYCQSCGATQRKDEAIGEVNDG